MRLFRDQQMIDLHWLAWNNDFQFDGYLREVLRAVKIGGILAPEAVYFASSKERRSTKANDFDFPRLLELGCSQICRDPIREKRTSLITKADRWRRSLQRARSDTVGRSRRSLNQLMPEKVSSVWLARELAKAFDAEAPSHGRIAEYLQLILGDKATRHMVRNQLLQVQKHIDRKT